MLLVKCQKDIYYPKKPFNNSLQKAISKIPNIISIINNILKNSSALINTKETCLLFINNNLLWINFNNINIKTPTILTLPNMGLINMVVLEALSQLPTVSPDLLEQTQKFQKNKNKNNKLNKKN